MKIIPAIDIIDRRCVRLSQGDYSRKTLYADDPVEVAKSFEDAGLKYLHLVDLDGAAKKGRSNLDVLYSIASTTNLTIDFGGGIRSENQLIAAFDNGATQVTLGSIAIKNPDTVLNWLAKYGSQKLILGADCHNRNIATSAWTKTSSQEVTEFIARYFSSGIQTAICTDIAKDGMLEGPSLALYRDILETCPVDLIASGGISSIEDVLAVKEIGCAGVIIGKAIYENRISLKQLSALC